MPDEQVFNGQSGCLSRRWRENTSALGPGRPSQAEHMQSGRRIYSKAVADAFMRRKPPMTARTPVAYCRV
jgi:hypothetical protein